MTLLTVQNLSWSTAHKRIVSDIDFSIQGQGITSIVGPNGAGKTTLLRLIYGALQPSQGLIHFQGEDLSQLSARKKAQKIAVVTQNNPLSEQLTVYELIKLGRIPHLAVFDKISPAVTNKIEDIMQMLAVDAFKDRPFNALSGGEQQRVLIARALVQEPKLLILDEPCNHLDIHFQHQILSILHSLNVAVLMTVHDLNLAAHYSDQLILMNNGQVIKTGSPSQVLNQSVLQDVFKLQVKVAQHPLTNSPYVFYHWQADD